MHQRPIKIRLQALREQAANRPAGYYEDCINSGLVENDFLLLANDAHKRLAAKYQGPAPDWPKWALVAALFAEPQDRGIGDTIAGELGLRTEAFKRHHEAIFGIWKRPCSCAGQVDYWNQIYPYFA